MDTSKGYEYFYAPTVAPETIRHPSIERHILTLTASPKSFLSAVFPLGGHPHDGAGWNLDPSSVVSRKEQLGSSNIFTTSLYERTELNCVSSG